MKSQKEKRGAPPSRIYFEDGTYDIEEFHARFIEIGDMTEYKAAKELLSKNHPHDFWQEWERLKKATPWFNNHVQTWKEELEIKFRSEAVDKIRDLAEDGNYQANKFLSEAAWDRRAGAGRPSNSKKKGYLKELERDKEVTKQEKARILKMVNNGG